MVFPPQQEPSEKGPAQRLVIPSDVLDLSDSHMTELYYVGTQGQKITMLKGLEHLTEVEFVSLRSNFIRRIGDVFKHMAPTLTTLELYENRLRTLDGVETLVLLETLDLSFNKLRSIPVSPLKDLTKLTKLYLAENQIAEIPEMALRPLVNLEVLDLGMNGIREIRGLETLVNLKVSGEWK